MSGASYRPKIASDNRDRGEMLGETTMTHGESDSHFPQLLSAETLSSGGLLLVGFFIVAGVLLIRNTPLKRLQKQPILSSLSSKATLGLGVFVMLTGGIFMGINQLKPASSTMEHEGHNMSHDEMMAVDGSFNPNPVSVEVVEPQLLEASVQYTGSIKPYQEITVYPRVAGQLTNYSVYPGDRVATGQPLAQLNAAELTTEVAEAVAETDTMTTALEMSAIEIDEQKSEIEQIEADLAYLNKKRERFAFLVKEGAISQDDFDLVDSEYQRKEATLKEARVKLSRLGAKVINDRAKVNQAQAKVSTAEIMEGYTTITSPIAGIVQERIVDPGVVVQPNMGILKIGNYRQLRLQANVAQQDAVKIRIGSPVIAKVPGTNIEPIRGKVTSIFPQADSQTRTVMVEAVIDNPDGKLSSGKFLEMQIITDRKPNTIAIPQSALVEFQDQSSVWVVEDDVVRAKTVTLGVETGDRVEVTSGLEPGEIVVTSGQQRLVENAPVAVINSSEQPIATHQTSAREIQIQLVSPDVQTGVPMGDAQLIIEVKDNQGQLLEVKDLEVSASMPMKNMAPMTAKVDVEPDSQPGRFKVETYLSMKGEWIITARVEDPEHKEKQEFTLEVR